LTWLNLKVVVGKRQGIVGSLTFEEERKEKREKNIEKRIVYSCTWH
jgi:hypothetical protein